MDDNVRKQFQIPDLPVFIGMATLGDDEDGHLVLIRDGRMEKLKVLNEDLKSMTGVHEVISVASVSGAASVDGTLNVGPLVDITPARLWKSRILSDQLLTPNLITKDARTVLVFLILNEATVELMINSEAQLKAKLARAFPASATSVGGVPAVQMDLSLLLNKELRKFPRFVVSGLRADFASDFPDLLDDVDPAPTDSFRQHHGSGVDGRHGYDIYDSLRDNSDFGIYYGCRAFGAHSLRVYEDSTHAPPGQTKVSLILNSKPRDLVAELARCAHDMCRLPDLARRRRPAHPQLRHRCGDCGHVVVAPHRAFGLSRR